MLTLAIMHAMWPNGDKSIPGLLEGIATAAPAVFLKYGLTSDLCHRACHKQPATNAARARKWSENINYTALRACQVWPSRFSK